MAQNNEQLLNYAVDQVCQTRCTRNFMMLPPHILMFMNRKLSPFYFYYIIRIKNLEKLNAGNILHSLVFPALQYLQMKTDEGMLHDVAQDVKFVYGFSPLRVASLKGSQSIMFHDKRRLVTKSRTVGPRCHLEPAEFSPHAVALLQMFFCPPVGHSDKKKNFSPVMWGKTF